MLNNARDHVHQAASHDEKFGVVLVEYRLDPSYSIRFEKKGRLK